MINFKLVKDSIFSPKLVFQKILSFEIKQSILIEATIFIAIVNTIFTYLLNNLISYNNQSEENLILLYYENILRKPFLLFFLEVLKILIITVVINYLGRLFGGKGSFNSILKCVIWIHFVLIFVNIFLFFSFFINYFISSYLIMLTNIWITWVLAECAAKAHGFKSTFLVFVVGILFLIIAIILLVQFFNANDIISLERVGSNV